MTQPGGREKRADEKFCSECGQIVSRSAKFCMHCGDRLMSLVGEQRPGGTGLEPSVSAALCYVLTVVTGVLFLLLERRDEYVRFHARQAIAFGVASFVGWVVLLVFTGIVGRFGPLASFGQPLSDLIRAGAAVAWIVLWIVLMVKAYQGERFKMGFLGDLAGRQRTTAGG